MKILVFMGSPRKNGCTATLLKPFLAELDNNGAEVKTIPLYDKKISPCVECYKCQNVFGEYGCSIKDDMSDISNELLGADCFILASPIFIWYCTAPMKAMLDRFYGLHKYYGEQRGSSLLEGKKCGIVTTCGYDLEYGIGPFEDGIKRFCEHFKIEYIGKAAVQRNAGDGVERFETDSSKKIAVDFADIVSGYCSK
jgi:multimeric flavodoxin WrbA